MGSVNSCIGNQIDHRNTTNDISIRKIAKGAKARGTTHDISTGQTTEGPKLGS
jgi:hypothetical protein